MEEDTVDSSLLRILAGRLIPASAEHAVPGADDAAIFAEIVAELRRSIELTSELADGLGRFGEDELAHAPLDRLLPRIQAMNGVAFATFAMAVIQAYYRDDRVMRSLDIEPRPPFPKGYVVEEGDFSLLAPVRARGLIWRQAT